MRINGDTVRAAGSVVLRPDERFQIEFNSRSVGLRFVFDGGATRTEFDGAAGDILLYNFANTSQGAFSGSTLEFADYGSVDLRLSVKSIGSPPVAYALSYTVVGVTA